MNAQVVQLHNALYRLMSDAGMNRARVRVAPSGIVVRLWLELGTFTVKSVSCKCERGVSAVSEKIVSPKAATMMLADTMPDGEYSIGLYGTRYEADVLNETELNEVI